MDQELGFARAFTTSFYTEAGPLSGLEYKPPVVVAVITRQSTLNWPDI